MTLAQWIDATHDPLPDCRPPPPSLRASASEVWGGAALARSSSRARAFSEPSCRRRSRSRPSPARWRRRRGVRAAPRRARAGEGRAGGEAGRRRRGGRTRALQRTGCSCSRRRRESSAHSHAAGTRPLTRPRRASARCGAWRTCTRTASPTATSSHPTSSSPPPASPSSRTLGSLRRCTRRLARPAGVRSASSHLQLRTGARRPLEPALARLLHRLARVRLARLVGEILINND